MDHGFIPSDAPVPAFADRPRVVPSTVLAAFEGCDDPDSARAYTRQLAHSHYENFSVVSVLLPRHLRQDFCNIYAFCRTADDLADEVRDKARASEYLWRFREQTQACYEGRAATPIFLALQETVRRHEIPIAPFLDLIDAFEQDQRIDRYDTFEDLVDYCRRSANPVGRLVLYTCGYRDAERHIFSDKTCTALQLANFWQDVRRDILDRDRIYLPRESMDRFGVSEEQIYDGRCDENYCRLIQFEVERTEALFKAGDGLLPMLRPAVRRQIALFAKGGRAVVRAIRSQGYDTLTRRPVLSRWQKGRLVLSALAAYFRRAVAAQSAAPNGRAHP